MNNGLVKLDKRVLMVVSVLMLIAFIRTVADLRASNNTFASPIVGVVVESELIKSQQMLSIRPVKNSGIFYVFTTIYPNYRLGEVVRVEGEFQNNRAYYPKTELVDGNNSFFILLMKIKRIVIETIEQIYPQPYASLVLGIVFGINRSLSEGLEGVFRGSGIMHIIVASGYNISVVIGFSNKAFAFIQRRLRVLITLIMVLLYAGVSGFDPPIIRACIMGLATVMALGVGRQKDAYLWLIFSALAMLVVSPSIIKSLSFQLSFSATLGIIMFQKKLVSLFIFLPKLIRADLATTFAVQIITTWFLWYHFSQIQPMSVIVNALILWAIPIVMSIGFLSLVFGVVHPTLGSLFAGAVTPFLEYVIILAKAFS